MLFRETERLVKCVTEKCNQGKEGEFKKGDEERRKKDHNYQGHREAFNDVELNGSLSVCSFAKWLTLLASVMLTPKKMQDFFSRRSCYTCQRHGRHLTWFRVRKAFSNIIQNT